MKLKILDITCPICKHKPSIKKMKLADMELIYLECTCTKVGAWKNIEYALSSWVIEIGKKGAFDWILKIQQEDDGNK